LLEARREKSERRLTWGVPEGKGTKVGGAIRRKKNTEAGNKLDTRWIVGAPKRESINRTAAEGKENSEKNSSTPDVISGGKALTTVTT